MRRAVIASVLLGLLLAACRSRTFEPHAVHLLTYEGDVDPVMERYFERGIADAEDSDAVAVVIELNTPGGLLDTTRSIVTDISNSKVPVIVWVAPSGAHAASAGTFITIAGHVAAMAPGTNLGAASPISATGEDIPGTLGKKIENDTVAFIRSIAEARGRNADWAEKAVSEAAAIGAADAVSLHVVDFVAPDLPSLLAQADAREVTTSAGPVVLRTAGAKVIENDMTLYERFLGTLADPNIAFLLLLVGGVLLVVGILHAGTFVPETAGAIALALAFLALSALPYSWFGVLLVIVALALLAGEIVFPSAGAFALAGVVALIFGGLFLTSTTEPDFRVFRWLVFLTAGLAGAFFVLVLQALMRVRRMPTVSVKEMTIGRIGTAETDLDPDGRVLLRGEHWNASSIEGPIVKGEVVEVRDLAGLRLTVGRPGPGVQPGGASTAPRRHRPWRWLRRPG